MTNKLKITIEGENLGDENDGDWTITLFVDGKLSAQTGLSGEPLHALAAAHELAIENDLIKDPDHD
jgi:hypothetical protein